MGFWPFSTIRDLRSKNEHLERRIEIAGKQIEELTDLRNKDRAAIKVRKEQVNELTGQVRQHNIDRKHTRQSLAGYVDVGKGGGNHFGRIVTVGDRPVKDRTLVLQPLAGRRKQSVEQAMDWIRKILTTFDVEPKGMPCIVERRASDGKINATEEVL